MKRKALIEVVFVALLLTTIINWGISNNETGSNKVTGAVSDGALVNPDLYCDENTLCAEDDDPCSTITCHMIEGTNYGYCLTEYDPGCLLNSCKSPNECVNQGPCVKAYCRDGQCEYKPLSKYKECDFNRCTTGDKCDNGKCIPGDEIHPNCKDCQKDVDCFDWDPCTSNYCSDNYGCVTEGSDECIYECYDRYNCPDVECMIPYCIKTDESEYKQCVYEPDPNCDSECEIASDCPKKDCKIAECELSTAISYKHCTYSNDPDCDVNSGDGTTECGDGNPNDDCTTDNNCPGKYDLNCDCVDDNSDDCPEEEVINSECNDYGYEIKLGHQSSYRPGEDIGQVEILVKDENGKLVSGAKVKVYVIDENGGSIYEKNANEFKDGRYISVLDFKIPDISEKLKLRVNLTKRGVIQTICTEEELNIGCKYDSDCDDENECTEDRCRKGDCDYKNLSGKPGSCEDGNSCTLNDYCNEGICISGKENPECADNESGSGDEQGTDGITQDNPDDNKPESKEDTSDENSKGGETVELQAPVKEYEKEIYLLQIELYPEKPEYNPGDTIEKVFVYVTTPDGNYVDVDKINGALNGVLPTQLDFVNVGVGKYRADTLYTIASDEKSILPIEVSAKKGDAALSKVRYIIIKTREFFNLVVRSPDNKEAVVPGQSILFEVELSKQGYEKEMENADVILIDERSDKKYIMISGSPVYTTTFTVPKNIYDSAYFLIWANTSINGTVRDVATQIMVKKSSELSVEFEKSLQDTKAGVFALDIRYLDSDGETISEQNPSATLTSYPSGNTDAISLQRSGDYYIGSFVKTIGDSSAEIQITDSYGNKGQASLPDEFFNEPVPQIPWVYILGALIIIVILVLLYSLKSALLKKKVEEDDEKSTKKNRSEELQNLIKRAKLDFYKRRISQEEANSRISEYQKELKKIRGGA